MGIPLTTTTPNKSLQPPSGCLSRCLHSHAPRQALAAAKFKRDASQEEQRVVDDPAFTLRESIKRLCEENASVFSARDISPEAQEFFRCHDTAHVVFGCDTSIFGEGILKMFTIFGTTLGFWKHLSGYAQADAFALFMQYNWRHVVRHIFKLLANIPRAFIHAKQMSRPWPWSEHAEYLDMSIEEIRSEFNIRVIRRA